MENIDMLCNQCGSVLSAVTFTCVRGEYCKTKLKRIYEFEIEAVGIGVIDSVEVQAESEVIALEKVRLWTREANSMTGRDNVVRERPVWISDFYVS